MLNTFTATVRATRDAEVKEFGQTRACVVGLVNSTNQKINNKWVENPLFFKGIVFGALSERLSAVRKGDLLLVTGQLVNRKYVDKNGEEQQDLNLEINKFEAIGGTRTENTSAKPARRQDEYQNGDLPF